jgi:hypothetical protein
MTHSNALVHNTAGLAASACTGELAFIAADLVETFPHGQLVRQIVEVHRCTACDHTLTLCEGRALTDVPPVVDLVKQLAASFILKR